MIDCRSIDLPTCALNKLLVINFYTVGRLTLVFKILLPGSKSNIYVMISKTGLPMSSEMWLGNFTTPLSNSLYSEDSDLPYIRL